MTDRELLELAAKAYWGSEINDICSVEWSELDQSIAYTHAGNQDHNGNDCTYIWNPLADDGDAFRLAVKLKLFVDNSGEKTEVGWRSNESFFALTESHYKNPAVATRRAIVIAAAEIGKGMK